MTGIFGNWSKILRILKYKTDSNLEMLVETRTLPESHWNGT